MDTRSSPAQSPVVIIILSNKTIKASLKPKHKSNVRVTTLARPILAPGIPR